jgi:hypothetical protein
LKVKDHIPAFWFLLTDDERWLFDVNCEHGAVGYSVLIELNEEERAQYATRGRSYLSALAEAINYSAPGVRDSDSIYKERDISMKYATKVTKAIELWRFSSGVGETASPR